MISIYRRPPPIVRIPEPRSGWEWLAIAVAVMATLFLFENLFVTNDLEKQLAEQKARHIMTPLAPTTGGTGTDLVTSGVIAMDRGGTGMSITGCSDPPSPLSCQIPGPAGSIMVSNGSGALMDAVSQKPQP